MLMRKVTQGEAFGLSRIGQAPAGLGGRGREKTGGCAGYHVGLLLGDRLLSQHDISVLARMEHLRYDWHDPCRERLSTLSQADTGIMHKPDTP